ncbi:hypothetical protein [Microbacterium testaceum]|uniref:hypothetical protein n=1 Tax=Microbacterium testaceum TaxID=2033 RepID=UPI0038286552
MDLKFLRDMGSRFLQSWREGEGSSADEAESANSSSAESASVSIEEWEAEAWPFHAQAIECAATDAEAACYAWQRAYYYFLVAHDFWEERGAQIVGNVAITAQKSPRLGAFLCEWIIIEYAHDFPGEVALIVDLLDRRYGWSFGPHLLKAREGLEIVDRGGGFREASVLWGVLDPRDLFCIYDPAVAPRGALTEPMRSWKDVILGADSAPAVDESSCREQAQESVGRKREPGGCELRSLYVAVLAVLDGGSYRSARDLGTRLSLATLVATSSPEKPFVLTEVVVQLLSETLIDEGAGALRGQSPWEVSRQWRRDNF